MMRDHVKLVLQSLASAAFIVGIFGLVGLLWAYALSLFGLEVSWWAASVGAFALRVGALLLCVAPSKQMGIAPVKLDWRDK